MNMESRWGFALGIVMAFGGASCGTSQDTPVVKRSTVALGLEKPLSDDVCQSLNGERIFRLDATELPWQAIKLQDKIVSGIIVSKGWLKLWPEGSSLTGRDAKASIEFDPKSLNSFDELRDTRIQSIILKDEPIRFELEGLWLDAKAPSLPAVGVSQKAVLSGILWLSGLEYQLDIPVVITQTETGFFVENGEEPFKINLRSEAAMVDQIEELLTVAAVASMNDEVSIKLAVEFKEDCKGAE